MKKQARHDALEAAIRVRQLLRHGAIPPHLNARPLGLAARPSENRLVRVKPGDERAGYRLFQADGERAGAAAEVEDALAVARRGLGDQQPLEDALARVVAATSGS
jgi:hypothetical protein